VWKAADEEVDSMRLAGDANMCCISPEGVDVVVQPVAVLSEVIPDMLIW